MTDIRVPFDDMVYTLAAVLEREGFTVPDAALSSRLFAEASRDGVASHGVERFPRFVQAVRDGVVDPRATPECVASFGAMERWDGRRGAGNLNAWAAMARAIALSRAHGVGAVALGRTNHWMRGGTYGWQAANAGVVGICWTNTMPNLPPWGATDARVGNNPLVVAVPRAAGHVVLDMAMSQFSYGALERHRREGRALPVAGGYDAAGALTTDAAAILDSGRPLPIGFWKGSGLALALDLVAAVLSGGLATHEIPADPARETDLSQLFLALDPASLGSAADAERTASAVVAHLTGGDGSVRYPGERVLAARQDSRELGVSVDASTWTRVLGLRDTR